MVNKKTISELKPFDITVDDKTRELNFEFSDNPTVSKLGKLVQHQIFDMEYDCMWSIRPTYGRSDERKNLHNKDVKDTLYERYVEYGNEQGQHDKNDINDKEKPIHKTQYPYDVTDELLRKEVVEKSRQIIPHIFKELNKLGILSTEHVSSCNTCMSHDISKVVRELTENDSFVFPSVTFHSQDFTERWFKNLELPVHVGLRDSVEIVPNLELEKMTFNGEDSLQTFVKYPEDDRNLDLMIQDYVDTVFNEYGFDKSEFGYKTTLDKLRETVNNISNSDLLDGLDSIFDEDELKDMDLDFSV